MPVAMVVPVKELGEYQRRMLYTLKKIEGICARYFILLKLLSENGLSLLVPQNVKYDVVDSFECLMNLVSG